MAAHRTRRSRAIGSSFVAPKKPTSGSEEAHQKEKRQDSSSYSQYPPPAKRHPPPHHCQSREDKQQCRTSTKPDSGDGVFPRGRDSAQEPAVANGPGPSPPQQAAERSLGFPIQGN